MAFEIVERIAPKGTTKGATPDDGVRCVRMGKDARGYIAVMIGHKLAHALGMRNPEHKLLVMVGNGSDAGYVAVALADDAPKGFIAKGKPNKGYRATINKASAEGLFAWEFEAFTAAKCEVIRPTVPGQPARFVFRPPAYFLETGD
ncbi:hypothetical protein [Sandarakinorhabdus sp. DWP1-3-1]|uniref:hypothetical protein n=1 Tax=Sandarakinorhabdus sp. DWP1-3-1 TaxID=2804627 RepID=UPI003CF34C14